MNLESSLNEVLEILVNNQSNSSITTEELIHTLDLTLLDEHVSLESLSQLNQDACRNHVAAVCVYSKHLSEFQQLDAIELATVINFPEGNEKLACSLQSIERAAQLGATEIDYVLPYRLYLDGKKHLTLTQCHTVIEFCKHYNLTTKIILETGVFSEIECIYELSKNLIELGCNFLKTSTGKIAQGASLPAVFTIISAIKDSKKNCGLKISGGIKKSVQAFNYAQLAELMMAKKIDKSWFRIGATSLLNELTK
ncbi:deoxyribose-phosphate aldolase [Legionella sp.]|uniref:deoxyribose-phosphate aldolase n=1 Tax=Legionella sp. TaxID=459 RepID=UPI003CBBDDD4